MIYFKSILTCIFIISIIKIHNVICSQQECLQEEGFSFYGFFKYVINITVNEADVNVFYNGSVTKNQVNIYELKLPSNNADSLRISTTSNNTLDYPVLFVIRGPYWIQSWQIPFELNRQYYDTVSRTLCPNQNSSIANQTITIEISSSSNEPLNFNFIVRNVSNFLIKTNELKSFEISTSEPQYYMFEFSDNIEQVFVSITSNDSSCMIVSIQETKCPVYDQIRDIKYDGKYQRVTKKGGFTQYKNDGSFFIVFVMDCMGCCNDINNNPNFTNSLKYINFTINEIYISSYYIATLSTVAFFLSFFIIAAIIAYISSSRKKEKYSSVSEGSQDPFLGSFLDPSAKDYGSISASNSNVTTNADSTGTNSVADDEEDDIDMLHDAYLEKDVIRTKKVLYVSDLSRKRRKKLAKKYKLYYHGLITIAVFYALPVIQLVVTYQRIVHETGNLDVCYYNSYCARPLGIFNSFNSIFSNIGYIFLGFLFLIIVWRTEIAYVNSMQNNINLEHYYGIPNQYGLFYAMGIALIMEGVFSACYHICPNYSNFQFDTSFMYMIATLCILKIYQTRHPDINAKSSTAYLVFAGILFLEVIGILNGSIGFWVIFTIIHILSTLLLSIQLYYMGRWRLNCGIFKRIFLTFKNDFLYVIRPMYIDRIIFLTLVNISNWAIALNGAITQPNNFANHLLTIFLMNLLLYSLFYIIMKLRNKERILLPTIIYVLLSCLTWGLSFYFYIQKSSSWSKTPAMSRESNSYCILFNFYDKHDVWHFLSACGLFFSFMVFLTLDDGLKYTKRDQILVF